MAVVLLSLLFFTTVGIQSWRFLALSWAAIPFLNFLLFTRVPLCKLPEANSASSEENLSHRPKLLTPFFFACIILMLCAGATELTVSQWSSMFAEKGLGVSKTVGDLLGPCAFAAMMGIGRVLYGLFGERIKIECALTLSGLLGVFAYLLTALAPTPILSLVGCFVAGFASALLWPGTYSLGASRMPTGGTVMFALFAMAGDIGASAGPALTGLVSGFVEKGGRLFGLFSNFSGADAGFRSGFLVGTLFPLVLSLTAFLLWISLFRRKKESKKSAKEKSC
jgi:MFS family permease